jgi:hypothetical protein
MLGWTVWLERKITSRVKNNPEHGKLSTQVRDISDVCNGMMIVVVMMMMISIDADDKSCC